MHRLKSQQAKEEQRVEERGNGGNVLFEIRLDGTYDVGDAEGEPVEKQEGEACVKFREGLAVRTLNAEDAVEPVKMIQIAGEDAENF